MSESAGQERREPSGLFREEALRKYFERQEHGDVLRLAPVWTRWTFVLILLASAGGGAYLSLARVTEYASGPAVVTSPGSVEDAGPAAGAPPAVDARGAPAVIALVPARHLRRLRPGMPILVGLDGETGGPLRLRVQSIDVRPIGPDEAARRYGMASAPLREIGPMLAVRAVADGPPGEPRPADSLVPGLAGTADVPIGSERLLFVLLPMLDPAGGDER